MEKLLNLITKICKSRSTIYILSILGWIEAILGIGCITFLTKSGVIDASIWSAIGMVSLGVTGGIVMPLLSSYGLEKLGDICSSIEIEIDKENEIKDTTISSSINRNIEYSKSKQYSIKNVQKIELNPQIEELFNDSVKYNLINESVLDEWHEYLYNTYNCEEHNIAFIQNLMYKLIILNNVPISECAKELSNDDNITNLLIHFGRKGKELANALNIPIVESKKEITR